MRNILKLLSSILQLCNWDCTDFLLVCASSPLNTVLSLEDLGGSGMKTVSRLEAKLGHELVNQEALLSWFDRSSDDNTDHDQVSLKCTDCLSLNQSRNWETVFNPLSKEIMVMKKVIFSQLSIFYMMSKLKQDQKVYRCNILLPWWFNDITLFKTWLSHDFLVLKDQHA